MIEKVRTKHAPQAIGPYAQGVKYKDLIFTSGQIGLDPNSMKFVGVDVGSQTRQALKNLDAVLKQAGASRQSVLKTTCFLSDMGDFEAFNEVYAEFFGEQNIPARSCVEASCLPKDALVEIEAVATQTI